MGGGGSPTVASNIGSQNSTGALNNYSNAGNNPQLQGIMSAFSSGQMSRQDALSAIQGISGSAGSGYTSQKTKDLQAQVDQVGARGSDHDTFQDPRWQQQLADVRSQLAQSQQDDSSGSNNISSGLLDKFYTDAGTGSQLASDFVRNDAGSKGLFGQGGIQDQAQGQYGALNNNLASDREALMGRDESYGLQDSDLKAYGQASSNISRLFGNAGQGLAQNLADRGLGSAPSGIANQEFSNLYGNQLEQLSKQQQQISQNRITTAQGLAQARTTADMQQQSANNSLIQSLGNDYQNAVSNQYGRQLAGAQNNYNVLAGNAGMQLNNQGLQQNVNNSLFQQEQSAKGPGLGGLFGAAAGGAIGSLAGGAGASIGANIGSNIFAKPKTPTA